MDESVGAHIEVAAASPCSSPANLADPGPSSRSRNITNVSVGADEEIAAADPLPGPSSRSSNIANVNDKNFEHTVEDWLLTRQDSDDNDSDIVSDDEVCPLPFTMRDAPACDSELTELEAQVLRNEDDLNDRHVRELVSEEYCTFNWTKERATFTGKRETFTGTAGPTFPVTEDTTETDIFYKMFDNDFIDLLCTETNRYADQKIASLRALDKLSPKSRLHKWSPTDRNEIITFIAIMILQGLYPLTDEQSYFTFNGYGTMPYFARIMSYNRFVMLKSFCHFVDNESLTDRTDRLWKIRPVLDYFNEKFSKLYMPSQNIAIDESLLKWHGRLSFAQKIATKAAQVGVKSYELCESSSGYLWKFFVYAGKKQTATIQPTDEPTGRPTDEPNNELTEPLTDQPDYPDETSNRPDGTDSCDRPQETDRLDNDDVTVGSIVRPSNATSKFVYDLIEPLLNQGHTLIMDNFYNSPLLLRYLKAQKTDCYGTLRLNREFVPTSIKTLTKSDLRQGEVVTTYCSDLSVMVWKDANLVSMISTYHHLQIGSRQKYNRQTNKPKILFNCYIIYGSQHSKISHRQFRVTLAENLLKIHRNIDLTTEKRLLTYKTSTGLVVNTMERYVTSRPPKRPPIQTHDHFPIKNGKRKARCLLCFTERKADSRTVWKCMECDVNLCIERCFRAYHK